MSWVKLDDAFFSNPKARAAGKEGRSLYIAGLCYCASGLTDGHIAAGSVKFVAAMAEVRASVARKLVEVGLWLEVPHGFEVHQYLEFNPSRAKVMAERAAARERRATRGRTSGDAPGDVRETFGDPVPSRPDVLSEQERAPAKKKRATSIDPEWEPSDATKEWCRREFPDSAKKSVLEHFRDHHLAKGSVFKDWDRAFQTWVRREGQFQGQREDRGPARTYL